MEMDSSCSVPAISPHRVPPRHYVRRGTESGLMVAHGTATRPSAGPEPNSETTEGSWLCGQPGEACGAPCRPRGRARGEWVCRGAHSGSEWELSSQGLAFRVSYLSLPTSSAPPRPPTHRPPCLSVSSVLGTVPAKEMGEKSRLVPSSFICNETSSPQPTSTVPARHSAHSPGHVLCLPPTWACTHHTPGKRTLLLHGRRGMDIR